MTCNPGSKNERAYIAAIRLEIAGGSTLFSRETVQTLIDCYQREAARFDELAEDVAFNIEQDDSHIETMYEEFTRKLAGGEAEADTVAMRDQIDRYKALGMEDRDAR